MYKRYPIFTLVLLILVAAAFLNLSCGDPGNATEAEREALLQAVRSYWENGRDYSLGFTSGVGELNYADVQGNEAEVRVDIVVGYTQPTDGAGYKDTTFRLRKAEGSWKVTYDGWTNKEV
jgi:hypothetical protein